MNRKPWHYQPPPMTERKERLIRLVKREDEEYETGALFIGVAVVAAIFLIAGIIWVAL